ncbi:Uncharacterised protein [Mycobacteroides abscessus]|nr:Uncharacterised protein [Mycobacteroides abscessus]
MSTFTLVPCSRKSGTWICAPVSSVAGLVPPVERSPCRPGSVYVISRTTEAGSSM